MNLIGLRGTLKIGLYKSMRVFPKEFVLSVREQYAKYLLGMWITPSSRV
jgi:hypothetical protein